MWNLDARHPAKEPGQPNTESPVTYPVFRTGVNPRLGEHFPSAAHARAYLEALPQD